MERLKELFEQAVDVPLSERSAWIADAAGGDARLAAELGSLLDAHDHPISLFDRPVMTLASAVGTMVGPYRIEAHLGSGGMGAVYRAVRADGEFAQQVAVKIVHRGMNTTDILRRFSTERQVLADLTHPNIAMILDGGTASDGQPYFVMEYVGGVPIDEYCRTHALGLRARLQLFLDVCAGVAHAHQRLVVHRDLKPDNILVRDDGTVKLLDFGIAKVLHSAAIEQTMTSVRPMTVRYASPEQVRGQLLTTTTDIYSLGVLLYRLLTGRLPYATTDLSGPAIERAICETDPGRPSDAARDDDIAREWAWLLRGDLDAILLMALRKEPDRRYQSVDLFASDLRRYLHGAPVAARPDTWRYRARKFVGRNRAATIAACVAVVALVAGMAGATWLAREARRAAQVAITEREKAELEAVRVQHMNQFLTNVLALPDASWYSPGAGGADDMTVTDLLIRAGQRIDTEFAEYPDLAADVHHTLGNTLRARKRCREAHDHFTRSLALRRQVYGARHAKVAESLYFLATADACLTGRLSLALFEDALAVERSLPAPTGNLPYLLLDLGGTRQYLGDFAAAEVLIRESLAVMQKQFGAGDPRTAFVHGVLGGAFLERGEYARAREQFQIVHDIARRLPPDAEILIGLGSPEEFAQMVELADRASHPDRCVAAQSVVALGQLRLKGRLPHGAGTLLHRGVKEVSTACGPNSAEYRKWLAIADKLLGGALSNPQ